MFLLVALVFLFGACEKDFPTDGNEGEKVEIFFSTDIVGYHTVDDLVRSDAVQEPESRTIPLNDDFYLRATLAPDAEDELRGDEPFIDGQKLCFAAYDLGGTQVGATAVYSYSTARGKWEPVGAPLGVAPDNTTEYRFVAYSYFGSTATPSETGIDPVYDLVWGKSENTKIVGEAVAERTVEIHMTHQFARVKVRVRSTGISATITTLSGVKVEGGKLATLTPFSGNVSFGGAATQDINISNSPGVNDVSSSYRTVTPVGTGPVTVTIGSVVVSASASTFSNKWTVFNSTLDVAKSYTLVVDLRQGAAIAYSNIYWDGTKMTFDETNKGHQGYQGLFFKWGSLVGISPMGTFSSTTPVYKAGTTTSSTYATWAAIPYENATNASSIGSPNVTTLKGDICTYIHSGYRMPRNGEFGTTASYQPTGGWTASSGFGDFTGTNTVGTYDFVANSKGYVTRTSTGMILPASGQRGNNDGTMYYVGRNGYVWYNSIYGTPGSATTSYCIRFHDLSFSINSTEARGAAIPVRCIRN
jgi:hypothetical protein